MSKRKAFIIFSILAGYGIQRYVHASRTRRIAMLHSSTIISAFIVIAFLINDHDSRIILFMLITAAICLSELIILAMNVNANRMTRFVSLLLFAVFGCWIIRHGMHLCIRISKIDRLLMIPAPRADFSQKSPAIEYVKARMSRENIPCRVIGEEYVLFPGIRVGVESLVSVEPVRSAYHENLLAAADYPDIFHDWLRLINSDQIGDRSALPDLLNVGYIVSRPRVKMPVDLDLAYFSDLDVWKRSTAWPRAFFTNRVVQIQDISGRKTLLASLPRAPFAAVENKDVPIGVKTVGPGSAQAIPAHDYFLTGNSIRFDVEASGPGMIVFNETYCPRDFVVRMNGKKADHIRVNQAFKGVWVIHEGKYHVEFTYMPSSIGLAIAMSCVGIALMVMIAFLCMVSSLPRRHKL